MTTLLRTWQRSALKLFWLFLAFWVGEAVAKAALPAFAAAEPAWALGFSLWFVYLCFFRAHTPCQGTSAPLLTARDVFAGLPLRGLALVAAIAAILVAVHALGLDRHGAQLLAWVSGLLDGRLGLFFAVTCTVILLTEGLSNTVVAAAFFPIAYAAATTAGLDPLALMIAVSATSTCAFMTPVATPCNALAFGEMRGVSLRRMLALGLVLNLVCASVMTLWLSLVIPLVYG